MQRDWLVVAVFALGMRSRMSSNYLDSLFAMDAKESKDKAAPKGSTYRRLGLCMACLIIFVIVYIIQVMASQQLPNDSRTKNSNAKTVTVVMNTFKRHEMMENAIDHYAKCNVVKYITVIWSERKPPPSRLRKKYGHSNTNVFFSIHQVDSLNSRFIPLNTSHTNAIFTVDDDIRVDCEDLELGYETWRNSPRTIVGFMPRIHLRGKDGRLVYRCWWSVWWHGMYTMILTKAAFLHHDYFSLYTNVMPQKIRDFVDKGRNCEDIAMQFLVANVTSLAPLYIKGHVSDLGVLNGISTSKNVASASHMDKRSQCLDQLVKIYGRNPLVRSHVIVDSAANGWTNVPSTWYEYISSDLWSFS